MLSASEFPQTKKEEINRLFLHHSGLCDQVVCFVQNNFMEIILSFKISSHFVLGKIEAKSTATNANIAHEHLSKKLIRRETA